MASRLRQLYGRLAWLLFYVALDVVVGAVAYAVSGREPDLPSGQLMIRFMAAIMLANGIVGGPDTMIFWRESGRRMLAEERLTPHIKNWRSGTARSANCAPW
jgi:hypothetical protein